MLELLGADLSWEIGLAVELVAMDDPSQVQELVRVVMVVADILSLVRE